MKRHFDAPIVVLISSQLIQGSARMLPDSFSPWLLCSAKIIFGCGLLWLAVRALDWWGEEAPVRHPRQFGKLARLSYREAQTRLQLIKLFNGNARLARRQVRILMARYPGQSEQWYWERAIVDYQHQES